MTGKLLEQGRISNWQAILLIVSLVSPTVELFFPTLIVKVAHQDAWLSVIAAVLGTLIISWVAITLSLYFPDKNLFEYPELILGRIPGKVISFLYVLWFIHFEIIVFGEFGVFLINSILTDTPIVVKHIVAASLAAYIARNGLEVMSRINQLFLPLILISLVIIISLSTNNLEITRLLPVYEKGMIPILKGALAPTSWLGEIVFLAVIIPYLNNHKRAMRAATISVLFTGCLMLVSALFTIATLGPGLSANFLFPAYEAVRMISISNFLERLDFVFVPLWTLEAYIKISLLRYAAALGSAQILGLKDYRFLVLPIGVIVIAGSLLMYGETVEIFGFVYKTWPFYGMTFELGIPLLLLIVTLVRGQGRKKS